MNLPGKLPPQVEAIGTLTGLLTDGGTTFQPEWFENPVADGATPTLANADKRLGALVSLLESTLSSATDDPPPVFTGPQWYAIPEPTTNTASPFCAVVPKGAPDAGQFGLGVLYTTTSANLVIEAYGYLPLVAYDQQGATIIASGVTNPTQIGVRAVTADGKGFAVDVGQTDAETVQATNLEAFVYLSADAYTQQP